MKRHKGTADEPVPDEAHLMRWKRQWCELECGCPGGVVESTEIGEERQCPIHGITQVKRLWRSNF